MKNLNTVNSFLIIGVTILIVVLASFTNNNSYVNNIVVPAHPKSVVISSEISDTSVQQFVIIWHKQGYNLKSITASAKNSGFGSYIVMMEKY